MQHVAVLLNTTFGFAHELMAGITRGWAAHPDWEFLLYQQEYPAPAVLKNWQVNGIIGFFSDNFPVDPYLELKVPIVNVAAKRAKAPVVSINVNQRAVGKAAAAHLLQIGVEHFGFTGFPGSTSSKGRMEGFSTEIKKHKYNFYVHWIEGPFSRWPDDFEQWLTQIPKPAAVFVASDVEARLLLSVCRRAKLIVPEDIAILGVNNEENICLSCRPTLSSIPTNLGYIGEYATGIMSDWLNGKIPPKRIIEFQPGPVIQRGSTERNAAFNDRLVARAISFMRMEMDHGIGVADVAKHCGVSQRTLEYHFSQRCGHSPCKELKQVRLRRACELLSHTELKLDEIACRIGFRSAQYLTTFFRKQTGKTPSTYRALNKTAD